MKTKLMTWIYANCKFAQAQISIDDSGIKQPMEKQLQMLRQSVSDEAFLAQTPLDGQTYLAKLEPVLTGIQEPDKSKFRTIFQSYVQMLANPNKEPLRDQVETTIRNLITNYKNRWGEIRLFYLMLIDFDEHVRVSEMIHSPIDQQIKEHAAEILREYAQGQALTRKLQGELLSFIAATARPDVSFVIHEQAGTDAATNMPNFKLLDFSIDFVFSRPSENSYSSNEWIPETPSFTLFVNEDGSYQPEDILSWGDNDFFFNQQEMQLYFQVIDFLRSGKLPAQKGSKFIKLWRGMSPKEYQAWQRGQIIPQGKFFTSVRTEQFAQDVAGEFPELFSFKIRDDIIAETGDKAFQTMVDAKLENGKIVPAG